MKPEEVALLVGVMGFVGVAFGTAIAGWISLRVQNKVDQADRRRQAAAILGRLRAYIDDCAPDQWAINETKAEDAHEEMRIEWRALRPLVLSLHVFYPAFDAEIEEVYTTGNGLLHDIAKVVVAVRRNQDLTETIETAKAAEGRARVLTNELMRNVGQA